MKKTGLAATAVIAAAMLVVGSATTGFAKDKEKKPSGEMANVSYMTATVEKIDHATRMVTLKGPEGNTVTFKVGPEAHNLDKVNAGDTVNVKYYEAVAWQVMKPGEGKPGMSATGVAARAPKGAQPGGAVGSRTTILATIVAIDPDGKHVTLKGPQGNTERVAVRHPENVKKVKVGDEVQITYTEAMAISVEPASPEMKK
jgi:Cu/Ag efflux protein CusF